MPWTPEMGEKFSVYIRQGGESKTRFFTRIEPDPNAMMEDGAILGEEIGTGKKLQVHPHRHVITRYPDLKE